jgi:hypothetical protein
LGNLQTPNWDVMFDDLIGQAMSGVVQEINREAGTDLQDLSKPELKRVATNLATAEINQRMEERTGINPNLQGLTPDDLINATKTVLVDQINNQVQNRTGIYPGLTGLTGQEVADAMNRMALVKINSELSSTLGREVNVTELSGPAIVAAITNTEEGIADRERRLAAERQQRYRDNQLRGGMQRECLWIFRGNDAEAGLEDGEEED